jgi:hypothetical protein
MDQHLTLSEAREFTGKSESILKRLLRDITSDPQHPERYLRRLFAHPANGRISHVFVPIVCDRRLSAFVFTQNQIFPANLTLV